MIQPLRALHRKTFAALAIVLPAMFWIGLRAREVPLRQSSEIVTMPSNMYLLRQSDRLWGKHIIQSKFYGDSANGEEVDVLFLPSPEMNDPDLLLYWTGDLRPATEISGWKLLGTFKAGRIFSLPFDAKRGGHLALYSLAHQEFVDSALVEKLP
jgi:hypothetical protein